MKSKLLFLALFASTIFASHSQNQKLFFIDEDNRQLKTINTNGTNENLFFAKTEALSSRYLAVNNTTQELFFSTGSPYSIYRKNLSGSVEEKIYTSLNSTSIYGIAVDEANSKVYWAEYETIKRSNLDGSSVETIINQSTDVYFRNVAIGGSKLYWAERYYNTSNFSNTYYIKRSNLDGTSTETLHSEYVPSGQLYVNELGTIYGMQVDATNNVLYWASSSADGIFKKNSDGTGSVVKILNDTYVKSPRGLAIDVANNKLFWTDSDSSFDNLRSANLDGSNVTVLSTTSDDPYGLALALVNENPSGNPEIEIQGNSLSIANNDATPNTDDNTDFGNVALNNNYKDFYFFIRNLGGANLSITGSPRVSITGVHAADFTLQTDVATTIESTSSSYFIIRFDPSVLGERTATVTVNSNDADEPSYTFSIKGTGNVSSGEIGTNDVRLTTHTTGASLDNEDPYIAYDPTLNRYLLVYEGEVTNGEEEIFGQFIDANGNLDGSAFQISKSGNNGVADIDAFNPKVVFNAVSNQFLVVWRADMGTTAQTDSEIFAQIINPNGSFVNGFDTGQIRISQNGPENNDTYAPSNAEVTVNTSNGNYYIVWQAPTASNAEVEIFGTILQSNGTLTNGLGGKVQLSSYTASNLAPAAPHVTYNPVTNQYLVVYYADYPSNGVNNVFGQIVAANGSLVSGINSPITITNVGSSSDADNPRVVYNNLLNEYFVGYQTDHINTDNEEEIFGQRIASNGTLISTPIQLSFAGIDGDGEETGPYFDFAYNTVDDHILVTFQSEEPGSNSYDIFATTLDASNYIKLETQSRVSDMGDTNGDSDFSAQKPKQVFNITSQNFFIVWEGDDTVPGNGEDEIFGQLWQVPPTAEIDIRGNTVSIADGDTTPDTTDNTDFGSVATSSSIIKEFTIYNTNTEQLVLNGTPTIDITGTNAADFVVTKQPNLAINAGESTTFEITFTPTAIGVKTANISIANNDVGENPYNFSIQGEGENTLDVELPKKEEFLVLYPNPVDNYLYVKGLKETTSFSVVNIIGKQVLSGKVKPNTYVELENLVHGVYIIKLKGHSPVKFIKK
ncbi:choice-of-anchor D domain-containing protein [Seonamhaeicola algicola]|uniref:Choice-of-anchor D domain-containing protein n=1 Tax=Seonamhaeicola algicola TaxID=1719036 RepID=A0A5C7AFW0_9FLAO|nr:choice-of-anchor D domain-containing protein [Seonamhaeicola algicola]TXE07207.1 choice-of-anchor D domain-containing protein [Seonamhaeicola algicola]